MNWYIEVMKKYATFSGRARRKEYWMFVLFYTIFGAVLGGIDGVLIANGITGSTMLSGIFMLASLVPSLAVYVRRLHDIDKSGWWILVPIANIIFPFFDSQPGENRFGPNPKEV